MQKNDSRITGCGADIHANASPDEANGVFVLRRWMSENDSTRHLPHVDANQLTSLSAMIVYVAALANQSEFRIERNLSDTFNIPNAKCLAMVDFDRAIRYLADILPH